VPESYWLTEPVHGYVARAYRVTLCREFRNDQPGEKLIIAHLHRASTAIAGCSHNAAVRARECACSAGSKVVAGLRSALMRRGDRCHIAAACGYFALRACCTPHRIRCATLAQASQHGATHVVTGDHNP